MAVNLTTLQAQLDAVDTVLNRLLRVKNALRQYAVLPADPVTTPWTTDEELAISNPHPDATAYDVQINSKVTRIATWTAIVLNDAPAGNVTAQNASLEDVLGDIGHDL